MKLKEGDTILADLDKEKGLLTFSLKALAKKEKSVEPKE